MAREKRPGKKGPRTKETTRLVKRKAKVNIPGQMAQAMMETGSTTRSRESAPTSGRMVASVMANGSTTTCPGMAYSFTLTECAMKVSSC